MLQTGEIRRPNAPLARDPWACRRLLDASLLILKEVDADLANNKWTEISPDGKVGAEIAHSTPMVLLAFKAVVCHNDRHELCNTAQCLVKCSEHVELPCSAVCSNDVRSSCSLQHILSSHVAADGRWVLIVWEMVSYPCAEHSCGLRWELGTDLWVVMCGLQVLEDASYASKVLPADGTSGVSQSSPMGPKTNGVAIWHDAQGLAGRSAHSIGRRPAPFLAFFRRLLMSAPADV